MQSAHDQLAWVRTELEVGWTSKRSNPFPCRVHGNGFIQIDMPHGYRLNVWGHPDIPRQAINTGIHDHRFDFTSTVLIGSMYHIVYTKFEQTDDKHPSSYRVLTPEVRKGEDTVLVPHPSYNATQQWHLREYHLHIIRAVDREPFYFFKRGAVHETIIREPTVTLLHKGDSDPNYLPRVFVPADQEPDNTHERASFDQRTLQRIVREVLFV